MDACQRAISTVYFQWTWVELHVSLPGVFFLVSTTVSIFPAQELKLFSLEFRSSNGLIILYVIALKRVLLYSGLAKDLHWSYLHDLTHRSGRVIFWSYEVSQRSFDSPGWICCIDCLWLRTTVS